jgi:nitroimidazol reductase NimA-like FMN-containing flavoprotein (pyridoxamine 5'-phosphate oxidase superfamily)
MPAVERPDMSGYGVRDDLEGALPSSWAEERLVANRNYWVVTVSGSGRPSAMPVWGVWLPGPERFRFSCAPTARKLRNIAANPQCVVMVDDTIECVSVEGRARIVDPDAETEAMAEVLAAYLPKYWPDPADHAAMTAFLRENTLVEVTPERAFGVIEREDDFARCATRWRW